MKKDIYRIIDANFNRSREGLRVCEEVSRFVWNSPKLTNDLRIVRHSVSSILKDTPATMKILNSSRDSVNDVLRRSCSKDEINRATCDDVFSANIQRVKESLRVLEEFFKLVDKKSSSKFTNLRFKVYEIEKKALK